MPCLVCGGEPTVRSHIIPKAITKDLRRGGPHAIQGSLNHDGVRKTPGGAFSDNLLCSEHEARTSSADTYGISFLRRAKEAFDAFGPEAFWVENPEPQKLSQFVAATIWREVNSTSSDRLGPYGGTVMRHVFEGGPLNWPILVVRDFFTLDDKKPIEFNTHPYKVNFSDRNAWMFTVLGFTFIVISDKRGFSMLPKEMNGREANPLRVIVGYPEDYRNVPTLRPIFDRMRSKRQPKPRA